MTYLCPFFKDDCKGNQCVMWYNEKCILVNFLQTQIEFSEGIEIPSDQIISQLGDEVVTIPEYIKSISPKDLAVEYIDFLEKEFPDSESRPYHMWDIFLDSKGVSSRYVLPSEIRLKIHKAEALVDGELARSKEIEQDVRLEKERLKIDSLVDSYLGWIESKQLNKVRLMDVQRFLREQELDVLRETERDIYDKAQIRLEEKNKEKIIIEREELPSLVDQCVDWARVNGLKSVTKADIQTFLLEKKLDIMKETQNSLYAITNTKLKIKR